MAVASSVPLQRDHPQEKETGGRGNMPISPEWVPLIVTAMPPGSKVAYESPRTLHDEEEAPAGRSE